MEKPNPPRSWFLDSVSDTVDGEFDAVARTERMYPTDIHVLEATPAAIHARELVEALLAIRDTERNVPKAIRMIADYSLKKVGK